jgi:HEAT repeat protein
VFRQFMSDDAPPPFDDAVIHERLRALAPEPALRFEFHRFLSGPGPWVVAQGACPKLTLAATRARGRRSLADISSLETEDPVFDRAFEVIGPPAVVHALLDDPTRAQILDLAGHRGVVEMAVVAGEVQVFVSLEAAEDAALVEAIAVAALALVAALATPSDVPARLARNARDSARPEVRARQLSVLLRKHPGHDETRAALTSAATDTSADVRLLAGQALGDEGRAVLAGLAAASDTPDAIAARAVDALKGTLAVDEGTALLSRGPLLARACLAGFVRGVGVGAVGQAAAEAAIAVALGSRDRIARAAAIDALAQIGSASAVALLEDAASREGGDLRRAARGAIASIQSRLVGADHGQISLVEGGSGQLSVATETGDLSLTDRVGDPQR